ncbi:MAG: 6-phosphogluconolactonase [Candidatus Riflebacteria bacterium]|nr:6-phosphogluconolactonase [Candidatus Riflebacteria bacterium]
MSLKVNVWPSDIYPVKAAEEIIRLLKIDYRQGNPVSIALSGGTTPKSVFQQLRSFLQNEPDLFPFIRWFQVDERNVPPEDEQSNQKLIRQNLFSDKIPHQYGLYFVSVNNLNPAATASEYEIVLQTNLQCNNQQHPMIDLVLLGVGEDGHTASLFPECDWQDSHGRIFREFWVEKLKTWRYSLTFDALLASKKIVFLATGSKKAKVLRKVLELRASDIPAGRLTILRDTEWWLDSEAEPA